MTEEEIDLMPAGRAMDMLIAEKIFGWRHYSDDLWERMKDWLIQRREFNWTEQTPQESMLRMMITPEGHSRWPLEYSTSIECAWVVYEHFEGDGIYFPQSQKAACLAICRAALKATL